MSPSRTLIAVSATIAAAAALPSCGPASRRDLGAIPQRQVTYDDLCRLQSYFDERRASNAAPFRVLDEQSTETQAMEADENGHMQRVMVGEGTYVLSDRPARRRLRELLEAEYQNLPPMRLTGRGSGGGGGVRVHVGWWASGQVRRLRPDRPVEITAGGETVELPFNPCVGEFLFGAEPYAMRRRVLDSEAARAHGEIPAPAPAASAPDAGTPLPASGETPDAGATGG